MAPGSARPINYADRCRMINAAGANLAGARAAALLATAYDTLARRAELVALHVADLTVNDDGTGAMLIRRGKTDQLGAGQVRFLASDTIDLIKRWLSAAGVADGPLFRSVRKGGNIGGPLDAGDVARIFKRLAARAGISADGISGHSTRIGAAQDLTAAGFGLPEVMQSGGWRTGEMVGRYTEHLAARRGAMAKLAEQQERA